MMNRILTVVIAVGLLAAGCRQGVAPAQAPVQPTNTIQPAPAPAAAPGPALAAAPGPAPAPAAAAAPPTAPAPANPAAPATLEVELNGDGRKERIEGTLGEWHSQPLHLYDSDGREIRENAFNNELFNGQQHRLEVVTIPGMDRPALVYEQGMPGTVHSIAFRWLRESLVGAYGWHPKLWEVHAAGVKIEADGTVVATNIPAEMGGYTWTRRYRITTGNDPQAPYTAALQGQSFTAGAHPTEPAALLTAAFIARWYGLDTDLERYIPDSAVRTRFKTADVGQPVYIPVPVRIGKLTFKQPQAQAAGTDPIPEIAPAPPGPDGQADFLAVVQQYEGGSHYAGGVTFGKASDGRLVVQKLEIKQSGFVY